MPAHPPWKGRGAVSQPPGRFAVRHAEPEPPAPGDDPLPHHAAALRPLAAHRIPSRNDAPDAPFDRSINPYQRRAHGCVYCYARPSHTYLDPSPGLDFETRIFYEPNAV